MKSLIVLQKKLSQWSLKRARKQTVDSSELTAAKFLIYLFI